MKKFIFLLVPAAFAISAHAQKCKAKDVPSTVTSAFEKDYPGANKCYWGKDSGNYMVAFYNGKAPVSVTYKPNGTKMLTEMQLPVEDLPQSIRDYVQKNYPNEIFQNVVQITNDVGTVSYEVEVKDMALEFDANGNFQEALSCKE